MIDFLATLGFVLGLVPVLLLIGFAFFTTLNTIAVILRRGAPNKRWYATTGSCLLLFTTVVVHYYLQLILYLFKG